MIIAEGIGQKDFVSFSLNLNARWTNGRVYAVWLTGGHTTSAHHSKKIFFTTCHKFQLKTSPCCSPPPHEFESEEQIYHSVWSTLILTWWKGRENLQYYLSFIWLSHPFILILFCSFAYCPPSPTHSLGFPIDQKMGWRKRHQKDRVSRILLSKGEVCVRARFSECICVSV